jgi:putative transcriptional regulator
VFRGPFLGDYTLGRASESPLFLGSAHRAEQGAIARRADKAVGDRLMTNLPESLQGHLLIAAPGLSDPNFKRSVILMIDHDDQGALGLVLNRPLNKKLSDIWRQADDKSQQPGSKAPVHWGGPVAGPLVAIHQLEAFAEVEIMPGIYFSTDKKRVGKAIKQSADLRFYVGCAGWSSGQLEEEIAEGAWGILPARSVHVMAPPDNLWKQVGDELTLGVMYSKLGLQSLPDNPEAN